MRTRLALALLLVSAVAGAQELGTLFHTPKERDLLERLRRGEKVETTVITRPDPTITGYVKRSDGGSTVFLDKQPYVVRDAKDEKLIQPDVVQRFSPAPPVQAPAPAAAPRAERKDEETSEGGVVSRLKSAVSAIRAKQEE